MAVNEVRVGLVGCGTHAREVILPAVQRAGMELAAVCDLDKRLAQRVTRRFGAFRAYQDIGTMVEEMDLDAVLACGPPEMHAEAAEVALQRGCHVWTEMPAAPSAAEAERLAELAAGRKLIAQVGLVMRHAPAYQRVRDISAGEDFGEIRSIEVAWWPPKMHGHEDPLLHDLPHALDLVRFIGGEIARISVARAGGGRAMLVMIELAAGAVASVSFAAPADCPREHVAVASMQATVSAEARRTVTLRRRGHDETSVWETQAGSTGAQDEAGRMQGFLPQMEHFARAVKGEVEPLTAMNDAACALRLVERAGDSAGELVEA